nr:bacteriophage Gp15 family protein [Clostridium neonatale]
MSSILINKLPVDVNINGVLYNINSDYRTSIIFAKIIEENELTEDIIIKILELYYPIIPEDIEQAINYIFWFYTCGKTKEEKSNSKSTGSNKKIYDYEEDSAYIYSAFLSQYKIDLQDIDYLHWWKFKALFESLSENNEIVKIMQYRSMDLSKIQDKEQKKFYKKMKDIYKLKEKISEEDKKALDDVRKLLK